MFLLVTPWLSQAMIDFKRIIAIINCNQQRMRIIMQRKGEKAETWLSNILIDGKVISWLLMTDFSAVSTSAKSVGAKGKEWLCYSENYCPQLTISLGIEQAWKKPADYRSGPSLCDRTAAWDERVWKCCELCSWFALQAHGEPSSPSRSCFSKPHQKNTERASLGILHEQNSTYDRNSVSHRLFDLKSFPLMKSQLTYQLYFALWYSQLKWVPVSPALGWSDVTPHVLSVVLPSSIAYICSPPALRALLFCSQEKGMSPPERLITCPCPISACVHMCWRYAHSTVGGGMLSKKTIALILHESLKECLHVCFQVLK